MPKDSDEVVVGANGQIFVAPVGTAQPADMAAFSASWIDLGFANEDGVTVTVGKDVENIGAWQSMFPIRRVVTARDMSLSFALRQWNEVNLPLAWGGGTVTTDAGPPVHHRYEPPSPEDLDERALAIEWLDGAKVYRLFVARGIVMEAVESVINKGVASDLPITFGAVSDTGILPFTLETTDPAFAV